MQNKKVQVLMSAYNGSKYIREQIDSILKQDYQNISLLIRDDGSTDNTVEILNEYAAQHKNVTYYVGENIGVINSFFDLINHTSEDAAYFAFSDQDDFWLEKKISRAVHVLEKKEDIPYLYCGNTTLVNENLNIIPMNIKTASINTGFGNALVENKATGCTCVMNRNLLQLLQGIKPEYTVMHDWWVYLTACAFGDAYFDEESYIYYRQHENNQVGSRNTYYNEFKARFKRFGTNQGKIIRQLKAFENAYKVNEEQKEIIQEVTDYKQSFKNRMRAVFSKKIYRQRTVDNIIFKLLFLLGKI